MKPHWFFETPVLPEAIPDPYEPPNRFALRIVSVAPIETQQPPSHNATGMLEWITRTVAETLCGARAVTQLERWLAPTTCRRLRIAAHDGGWGDPRNAKVTCIREHEKVIAAVAHLAKNGRIVAAVIRLEAQHGRWRCTNFDLLLPGAMIEP
ncbi:MAG: Rv3235 family protein [Propionibacteriaceae bacterium]|jgi:hypothetical protein|nr:Rv3235 family protein [Propionibacteriaceae bacterium]